MILMLQHFFCKPRVLYTLPTVVLYYFGGWGPYKPLHHNLLLYQNLALQSNHKYKICVTLSRI